MADLDGNIKTDISKSALIQLPWKTKHVKQLIMIAYNKNRMEELLNVSIQDNHPHYISWPGNVVAETSLTNSRPSKVPIAA
ncbi:hypothetical protein MY4038_000199 [Beauveria bassiana]